MTPLGSSGVGLDSSRRNEAVSQRLVIRHGRRIGEYVNPRSGSKSGERSVDMPRTKEDLLAVDRAHLIHPLHNPGLHANGHVWTSGSGAILIDADGREFLDVASGLWNVVAGHGRRELIEAASRQAESLAYCSLYSGSSNVSAIELAERLAGLAYPSINHFFFTCGGGESIESAVKTARYYWKAHGRPEKVKTISRQWGYHGTTLSGMSATGMANYWPMFEPRVPGFVQIPSPYPYRYKAPPGVSPGIAMADELEQAILREGPETVAMFLAEPVQGGAGVIVPPDDYFPRIREICDQYNVLFCADEIITGFGRTGKWFGLEHWGIEPDLMTFAKAITSGYFPLGGMGVSDAIADTMSTSDMVWLHAYTYSGHPVGCAVALANLEILDREDFRGQAVEKGSDLRRRLHERLGAHPHVGEIRGIGLMTGVEFVQDRETRAEFDGDEKVGQRIHVAAQDRGLFTRIRDDIFCIAPPYVITTQQIDQLVERLGAAVEEVLGP